MTSDLYVPETSSHVANELLQMAIDQCGADALDSEEDLPEPHGYDFVVECLPHRSAILSFAGRLTLSRSAADDLVQDTYCKAFQAWPRFEPDWSRMERGGDRAVHVGHCAKAWLYRICMNRFVSDYHRTRFRRKQCTEQPHRILLETYNSLTDGNDPRDNDDGIGDQVRAAVQDLDADQREMITRADFRGEHYVDIARDLNVPIGTVMSRLHRARRKLRPALADYAASAYRLHERPVLVPKRAKRTRAARSIEPVEDQPLALAAG